MAVAETQGLGLTHVVALLGAGVVFVPLFRRLGLGSVLGYLAAGLVIGPFGLGLFSEPESILHAAELGVVLFLFVIGLEMQPSRLWSLRREIFGLGLLQVLVCGAVLTFALNLAGLAAPTALIAALGFTLSSTAIVVQILEERGEIATPQGQRTVSILLFEDLAIVPLLALVSFLAPAEVTTDRSRWMDLGLALAAIVGLIGVGKFLLNPFFRLLAAANAREVLTAAALLVVLGAALLMQVGGLSMAMGAFLAGVMLSESTFRHQLEADVEPFRGILLGLFFISVGMSLDLSIFSLQWPTIAAGVVILMFVKGSAVYGVARSLKASHPEAMERALLLAQGGEFAFVLYSAAAATGIFDAPTNAVLTAIVILSMALTPLAVLALRWLVTAPPESLDGVDKAKDLHGDVLIVGFGRFGQVASQMLLARGMTVSIIDTDIEMITAAERFGFKVYYGDGTRLDVLRAAGAASVKAIAVCTDKPATTNRVVELSQHEFGHARLLVRSFDREHSLKLIAKGVDLQIRETFESAMVFGESALVTLGVSERDAREVAQEIRRLDRQRLELELTGGLEAGRDIMLGNAPRPLPLVKPQRTSTVVDVREPAT